MIPMGGISRRVSREVHLDIYTGYIVDPVWAYGPNTIGCDMYRFILDEYAPFNISTHLPNTISHTPPTRQPARPLPHPRSISESPFSFFLSSFFPSRPYHHTTTPSELHRANRLNPSCPMSYHLGRAVHSLDVDPVSFPNNPRDQRVCRVRSLKRPRGARRLR